MHAYRPTAGTTNGNSTQYQGLSTQSVSGAAYPRVSPGSTNQAILAPLAPRPSPSIAQHGVSIGQPLNVQAVPAEQFALFGYTFDGQTFADNDLPPRMRQGSVQQANGYERSRLGSGARATSLEGHHSQQHPKLQYVGTGGSDSGVDIGHLGSASQWSHSSLSSSGTPMAPTQPNQATANTIRGSANAAPSKKTNSLPQALFPPQADQQFPECWIDSTSDNCQNAPWTPGRANSYHEQHSSGVPAVHPHDISPTTWYGAHETPQNIDGRRQSLEIF